MSATVVGTTTRRSLHHFYRHDPDSLLVTYDDGAADQIGPIFIGNDDDVVARH